MSGKKGRSGRRPLHKEERRLQTIDKSWKILDERLNDPNTSIEEKVEIAKMIVSRDISRQTKGQIEITPNIKYICSVPSSETERKLLQDHTD